MSMLRNVYRAMRLGKARRVVPIPACKEIGQPKLYDMNKTLPYAYNMDLVVPAGNHTKEELTNNPWVFAVLGVEAAIIMPTITITTNPSTPDVEDKEISWVMVDDVIVEEEDEVVTKQPLHDNMPHKVLVVEVAAGMSLTDALKTFETRKLRKTVTREVVYSKLAHMTCISDKLESMKRFLPDPNAPVVMSSEESTSDDEWQ